MFCFKVDVFFFPFDPRLSFGKFAKPVVVASETKTLQVWGLIWVFTFKSGSKDGCPVGSAGINCYINEMGYNLLVNGVYMIPVSGFLPPPPPPNVMTLSTLPIAPMTIWRPPCCFEGELAEIDYRITSGHVWSLEYLFMP